ncbi:hypothetical protein LA66_17195 [Aureimonas altamirensis]|uniref:Iron ABC transporter n=1 Tax=Aureimonas altamirensis TaxID=370622 RepID=A0A0B1Q012_9HYPH|nr:Fe(3+)-hydroxamate ABC transporter permease FhuB [Aureimonas altamirensis]KHJ53659.1 hypothetical protein LA66_17195 [Aureimonas altamirensis]
MKIPSTVRFPLAVSIIFLSACAAALTLYDAVSLLSPYGWWHAMTATDLSDPHELLARYAFAPRVAVSILAGASLGLAGLLLSHSLSNPLAEPTTLGTSAGAGLALTASTLYAPSLLAMGGRGMVALAGAAAATGLTFAIGWRRRGSPVSLVLSGLVVTMVSGSAAAGLIALDSDNLSAIFVWQSGSLVQSGDRAAQTLLVCLLVAFSVCRLLARPLTILGFEDALARSLGQSPGRIRFVAILTGVVLAANVVSFVGVIAFIGLAAPVFSRILGARSFHRQLVAAPALGALMLWLIDRVVFHLESGSDIPTGAAAALVGAPVLLFALASLRYGGTLRAKPAAPVGLALKVRWPALVAFITLITIASFTFGRGPGGWEWLAWDMWQEMAPYRLPRIAVSFGAGILLAVAGAMLQTSSGNPMASPEFLGASGGAALGVLVLMLVVPYELQNAMVNVAAALGSLAALTLLLGIMLRRDMIPERVLLTGWLIAIFASSVASLVLAGGDTRVQWLQLWLTGSTYRASATDAIITLSAALLSLAALPFIARWLVILPLGRSVATSAGVPVTRAYALILTIAAGATAVATVVIGPLSFIGLMAPHFARLIGFRRPMLQIYAAAFIGASILVISDWIGRTVIYPWQVPAGLVAALVGAPAFIWLMRRPT